MHQNRNKQSALGQANESPTKTSNEPPFDHIHASSARERKALTTNVFDISHRDHCLTDDFRFNKKEAPDTRLA